MNINFIFKRFTMRLNYVRIADSIFFLAGVLFFTSLYIIVFPPKITTEPLKEKIGIYKVWLEANQADFTKPWFEALRYGMLMLTSFSAALFIKLWIYFYINFSKKDFALFWFALAMLSWSFAAVFKLLDADPWAMTLLSQLNNLFFLLSFPHFKHGFKDVLLPLLRRIGMTEQNYTRRVCLFFLIILISCLPLFNITDAPHWWGNVGGILNLFMSCFMGFMLIVVLWSSFDKREFYAIKWLSIAPTLCLLIGEILHFVVPHVPKDGYHLEFVGLSYTTLQVQTVAFFLLFMWKVMLMVLVAGLAMSWLYEKIETQRREMVHLVKNGLHEFLIDMEKEKSSNFHQIEMLSRVKNLRDFVENVFSMHGDSSIYIRPFLDDTVAGLGRIFQFKPVWDFSALDGIRSHGDPARDLGKLITELVLNAYKYGGQSAMISSSLDEEVLTIKITDKGDPYFDFKENPDYNGLGIQLFHTYLKTLDGTFEAQPKPKGKTLILNFSISTFTQ